MLDDSALKAMRNRNRGLRLIATRYERALINLLRQEFKHSPFSPEYCDEWISGQLNRIKAGKSRWSFK